MFKMSIMANGIRVRRVAEMRSAETVTRRGPVHEYVVVVVDVTVPFFVMFVEVDCKMYNKFSKLIRA
jgi:hypothetical protein